MRHVAAISLLIVACQREERTFQIPQATARPVTIANGHDLYAGSPPTMTADLIDPELPGYAETAYFVAEGATLYNMFNCVGCHANGGGAIGPAFMDTRWLYGSRPQDIAESILAGRPNGMPSFRGKLGIAELYKLVAYVRALGGFVRGDAIGGRLDTIHVTPPFNLTNAGWPELPGEGTR